jgi:hypothetical protein
VSGENPFSRRRISAMVKPASWARRTRARRCRADPS